MEILHPILSSDFLSVFLVLTSIFDSRQLRGEASITSILLFYLSDPTYFSVRPLKPVQFVLGISILSLVLLTFVSQVWRCKTGIGVIRKCENCFCKN